MLEAEVAGTKKKKMTAWKRMIRILKMIQRSYTDCSKRKWNTERIWSQGKQNMRTVWEKEKKKKTHGSNFTKRFGGIKFNPADTRDRLTQRIQTMIRKGKIDTKKYLKINQQNIKIKPRSKKKNGRNTI